MLLDSLRDTIQQAATVHEKLFILDRHPLVSALLVKQSFLKRFLQELDPERACALKQLIAIGEPVDPEIHSIEKWQELLQVLLPIDVFYRPIGGIV